MHGPPGRGLQSFYRYLGKCPPECTPYAFNNGGVRVAEARSPSIQLRRLILIPQAPGGPEKWSEHKRVCQLAPMAVATLALLVATGNFAEAGSSRKERSIEWNATRTAGEPIMAIVSLRSQQITVYDADGWIMRAPVSSGQAGRETPAGIFSLIQKHAP